MMNDVEFASYADDNTLFFFRKSSVKTNMIENEKKTILVKNF